MNESYLCRGKRQGGKGWIEGYYAEIPAPPTCCGPYKYPTTCIVAVDERYMPDWDMPYQMAMYEVDPSTVGRCTGLRDKSGKLIYEGDIASIPGSKRLGLPAEVRYMRLDARFMICRNGYNPIGLEDAEEWCVIVGNVTDNQELLGGEEDG